jgi:hypothetical protein
MASLFAVGLPFSYDGTTNHFATTTGGTATVAAVTAADTVTVDSLSGNAALTLGVNMSCSSFTMNNASASLNINAKTLTCGLAGVAFTWTAGTYTSTAGSTILLNGSNATFAGGGKTYDNVTWQGGGNCTITGANTYTNLITQPNAGQTTSSLILQADQIITGTWTSGGRDSGTTTCGMLFVCPAVFNGSLVQRTITAAAVSLNNIDFHHINAAGAAIPFTGTNIGDASNNSNITFSTPRTVYWVGDGGNSNLFAHWSTSTGGATGARPPCANDTAIFDANSITLASQTITFNIRCIGKNVDFSAVLHTPTMAIAGNNLGITGSLTFAAGMTQTANAGTSISTLGAGTLTTNGVTPQNIQINSVGTLTLADDLTLAAAANILTFAQGTWDANNKNIQTGLFTATNTTTRAINNMTGNLILTGTGFVINMSDVGVTLTNWTPNISITDTSATSKTVNMPNSKSSFNGTNLSLSGGTGSITIEWAGAGNTHLGTLNNLTVTAPANLIFIAGQVSTFTNAPTMRGTAGNLITITSGTPGSQYTFSKASGIVSCDYLSLTDSNATGGASWYAGANSTSVSNNTGWIFAAAPSGTPNMLLMGIG